jgi:hypothetical protein
MATLQHVPFHSATETSMEHAILLQGKHFPNEGKDNDSHDNNDDDDDEPNNSNNS